MRTGESSRARRQRTHRALYVLGIALLTGGLALAAGFGFGAGRVRSHQAEAFPRFPVPSAFRFHVADPATYYVYAEGTVCADFPNCHGALYPVAVAVTGPGGQDVAVERTRGPSYGGGEFGGPEGSAVATFTAVRRGDYKITVSTGPYSEGRVAIGRGFPNWTAPWVLRLAMTACFVAGVAVIAVPLVKRRWRAPPAPRSRAEKCASP